VKPGSNVLNGSMEMPLCGVKFRELLLEEGLVVIRGACRSDRDGLLRFFESLDEESVYERFHHIVKDFSSYVNSIIESNSFVVVAELNGVIVGVAEAVACREGYVEVAVIVSKGLRGRGLGSSLCLSLGDACRRFGVKSFIAYVRRSNVPALSIARRLGASIKPGPEPGLVVVEACFEG
jgi:Sortase and related acyltransferases